MASPNSKSLTLLNLPTEIHYLISQRLAYPDLLALTLTHPHFREHSLVRTSKTSRVDWLLDRHQHRLTLPSQGPCRWSSDREFVSNPEIIEILRRRRRHLECAEVFVNGRTAGTCLVFDGQTCPYLVESSQYLRNEKWMSVLGFGKASTPRRRRHTRSDTIYKAVTSWYAAGFAILLAGVLWLVS